MKRFLLLAGVLSAAVGTLWWSRGGSEPGAGGTTGLFTTLPILWNEAGSIAAQLGEQDQPHWARAVLAQGGRLIPLDVLAAPGSPGPLDGLTRLVIAQPRPLSGEENVALDEWVRAGGRVLLLADPALTEESLFAIGDRRRPQSTVLLSPILRRWGLDLLYDPAQPLSVPPVMLREVPLPVSLSGKFALLPGAQCETLAEAVVAVCTVGRGRVVAVADAAVLEQAAAAGHGKAALIALLRTAFPPR